MAKDRRQQYKDYHAKHREERCAKMRARYHAKKALRDGWRARNKKWYEKNREKKIAKAREWAVKNPERRAAYARKWWLERGKILRFRQEEGRFPWKTRRPIEDFV